MTRDELDAAESDRRDRKCNVLAPAFWWCAFVIGLLVWAIWKVTE